MGLCARIQHVIQMLDRTSHETEQCTWNHITVATERTYALIRAVLHAGVDFLTLSLYDGYINWQKEETNERNTWCDYLDSGCDWFCLDSVGRNPPLVWCRQHFCSYHFCCVSCDFSSRFRRVVYRWVGVLFLKVSHELHKNAHTNVFCGDVG